MLLRIGLTAVFALASTATIASAQPAADTGDTPDPATAAAQPAPTPPAPTAEATCFERLRRGQTLSTIPGKPVTVSAGIDIVDILEIDGASETFAIDFYLIVRWQDARLAHPSVADLECTVDADEVWSTPAVLWNPRLEFINLRSEDRNINNKVTVAGDGSVEYSARISATFDTEFSLADFPFDTQQLTMQLETGYNATQVVMKPIHELSGDSGKNWWRTLPQWRLDNLQTTESRSYWVSSDAKYSRFTLTISAQRRYGFYIWKVFVPLVLIIFLSWTVFWMHSDHFDGQMAVSITCLLALIAFNFVIGDELPKISYLTVLDWSILLAYVFVFLAAVENVLVHYFAVRDRSAAAATVETVSRWLFPLTYLAANVILLVAKA